MPKKKRQSSRLVRQSSRPYSIMGEVEDGGGGTVEEFVATGRTGRRNAMANVLDSQLGNVSTASLPLDLAKLSCSDADAEKSESEKSDAACASGSSSPSSTTTSSSSSTSAPDTKSHDQATSKSHDPS